MTTFAVDMTVFYLADGEPGDIALMVEASDETAACRIAMDRVTEMAGGRIDETGVHVNRVTVV